MKKLSLPSAHQDFLETACRVLREDVRIVGVAVSGSLADDRADEYSDVDLMIAVEPAAHAEIMAERRRIAESLGRLLAAFAGEHVGEPRLLVCLYDDPVLHADLKFVALPDAVPVVDTPVVLWERDGRLGAVLGGKVGAYPAPADAQWIEDRFWVWVHYLAAKIGRGEWFDAIEGLSFLRMNVLGPLGLAQRGRPPSGVRRVERDAPDLAGRFAATLAGHDGVSLWRALDAAIGLYRDLRAEAGDSVLHHTDAERAVMRYVRELRNASSRVARPDGEG